MLCDIYAIVEKGRVYVEDKMNIECWGPILYSHLSYNHLGDTKT